MYITDSVHHLFHSCKEQTRLEQTNQKRMKNDLHKIWQHVTKKMDINFTCVSSHLVQCFKKYSEMPGS